MDMLSFVKKSIALFLIVLFLITSFANNFTLLAKNNMDQEASSTEKDIVYASYDFENKEVKNGDIVDVSIDISQEGSYELELEYQCISTQDIVVELSIDGSNPFSNTKRLTFPCFWINKDDEWIKAKSQYTPEQILYTEKVESKARDYTGEKELPYSFEFTAGTHNISIKVVQGDFILHTLKLILAGQTPSYTAPDKKSLNTKSEAIIIEGESAEVKNSRSLIPLSDAASPLVTPYDAVNKKLNYIGGSNWESPGEMIVWSFEVPEDGYYCLGFNYRQSQLIGSAAYRSLEIDGEVPFEEARRVKFVYDDTWKYFTYADEKENPYYIYLSKGKHTVSLTATIGELSLVYEALNITTMVMGDLYVDITKVIGETVDMYRSYELFNQVPDFNKRLEDITKKLNTISKIMVSQQESKTSSNVNLVDEAMRSVKKMLDNPYTAHRYKSEFYSAYTNLSALMMDIAKMQVDIDQIVISGSGDIYQKTKPPFFDRLLHSVKRFLLTFSGDYNTLSAEGEYGEALTIWINWGRDQSETFNSVVQDEFVRKTGIPVNVSLVNASIVQAILSGKGPDCLIQTARTEPVNLAMRGALYDLSSFEDFEEVSNRFTADATLPYTYKGGVYALPVTKSFYLMFVRTDILKNLAIDVPRTWDEYIDATTILQRNNLQAVIPYNDLDGSGTVNIGVGGITLYPTLLVQKGLSLYNKEENASALSETKQVQTFVEWTEFYTKYKFQEITNFYNRFRIGSAPLGIADYSLYLQLKTAAPEIDGRWTVYTLPGTVLEDGTINNSSATWGTGCCITNMSKNPKKAWEFLKWWTSADIQLKYSNMLESVLGPLGRISTANLEALDNMNWDMEMYKVISEQKNLTVEIPEIPGGYYSARGIDQAFWNVTENGKNPTEMIKKWSDTITEEIKRKKAEYEN